MQIVVRGNGPALLLLHGWAMHGGIFAPLLARLEHHFTLHIVDLPGHGCSSDSAIALDLDAIVRHLVAHTPRALWLGWSLGGLVALQAAQAFPASVRGLLMLCASPCFVRNESWPQGMDASIFRGFGDDLAGDYRATIDRFLRLETHGSDHAREQLRLLREQVFVHGAPAPEKLREGLALLQDSDLRPGLAQLKMPSLWLAGQRDRLVSPQAMQAAAELTGHAGYQCISGAGHAPFLTHADEVARAITLFSDSLPA